MNDLHLVIERNKKKSNKYAFTKRETPVRLRSAGRLMNWVAMMMEWFSFFFFFFPLRAAASSVEEEEKKWLGEESGVCLAYLFCYIAAALLLSLLKDFVASHIAVTSPSVRKKTQKRKKPNLVFLEGKKKSLFVFNVTFFLLLLSEIAVGIIMAGRHIGRLRKRRRFHPDNSSLLFRLMASVAFFFFIAAIDGIWYSVCCCVAESNSSVYLNKKKE